MFYWIYDYPSQYMAALFGGVFVGVTLGGIFLFRPLFQSWIHGEPKNNDMVGLALSSFSVFYGLLVGLVAVGAYQNFSTVGDIVDKEASSLAALYRDVSGYPQPIRAQLQDELREYARYTIEEGWPMQARGAVPPGGTARITMFFDTLAAFEPAKKSEELIHAEALRQFNALVEFRRARIAKVDTGIPAVLWWTVAIGAMIMIGIIWMLKMEIHVHVILGAALSLFLGLMIYLIAAMDNPFRGEVSIGADPIRLVYDTLMQKR